MKRHSKYIFLFLSICLLQYSFSFSQSVSALEQNLQEARKSGDATAEVQAISKLGSALAQNGNAKRAIQLYMEGLILADEYKQLALSGYFWNQIAGIHSSQGSYSEAVKANTKAFDFYKKANDKDGVATVNIDLGDSYFGFKKYQESISAYKQALQYYNSKNDAKNQAIVLSRIGRAYTNDGNLPEAIATLNKGLEIANRNQLTAEANMLNQNLLAVQDYKQNKESSVTNYDKRNQDNILKEIEQLTTKEKNQRLLLLSQENIILKDSMIADSLRLVAERRAVEAQRQKLEADKKAKENELLQKDNELSGEKLKQQQWIIWGGIAFSVMGVLLTFYIFWAYRNKKKANDILTQKNEIIYKQKEQIEQKNMLITDSIDYAKNIQDAILPAHEVIAKNFPESFILYKPKDIVSGDFYWTYETNSYVFLAAADCTGHGVPGAFMSLLGFIMLDEITKNKDHANPAQILKEVNTQLMTTLHQDNQDATGKFGMDIALVKYNKQTQQIVYSGAHNPLIVVSDGKLNEHKADRVSIGTTINAVFNDQFIQTKTGDTLYLYSDGFQDQIGGEKRKKFLAFNMKELFVQIDALPMSRKKEILEEKHLEWRGKNQQTDDVLVIGLKIT